MIKIKSESGKKCVNLFKTGGKWLCNYCDVYDNEEQVLESKTFKFEKAAKRWADKKLEIA